MRWVGSWAEKHLPPTNPPAEEIRTGVMAGGYLQIDETPIRYLSPGNGQTKLGYFWTALSPGGDVVYHWETSRAECLKNVIAAKLPRHPPMRCLRGLRELPQAPRAEDYPGGMLGPHTPQLLRSARAGPAALRMDPAPDRPSLSHRGEPASQPGRSQHTRRHAPEPESSDLPAPAPRSDPLQEVRPLPARSAFGQAIDHALSNWSLLGVYLEEGVKGVSHLILLV
jgi:transposase